MTRKICYEELFETFSKFAAETLLPNIPEARGLALVVDWHVGKNDFPAAHMVTRTQPTDESILATMQQTIKLLELLGNIHKQRVVETANQPSPLVEPEAP